MGWMTEAMKIEIGRMLQEGVSDEGIKVVMDAWKRQRAINPYAAFVEYGLLPIDPNKTVEGSIVLAANEYRCAMCGNVYLKAVSDEEAMTETNTYWPDVEQGDCAVICDDCWEKIRPEDHPQEYNESLKELREAREI